MSKRRPGAPVKIHRQRVEVALEFLKQESPESLGHSQSEIDHAIDKLTELLKRMDSLLIEKSRHLKPERHRIKEDMRACMDDFFSPEANPELYSKFKKEVGKRTLRRRNEEGKGHPFIRVSPESKSRLEALTKITSLRSPAQLIERILGVIEEKPERFLDQLEALQYKKTRTKKKGRKLSKKIHQK